MRGAGIPGTQLAEIYTTGVYCEAYRRYNVSHQAYLTTGTSTSAYYDRNPITANETVFLSIDITSHISIYGDIYRPIRPCNVSLVGVNSGTLTQ